MQEHREALATLQDKLLSTPVLTLPRSKGQMTLDSGAGDKEVGCVLMQYQPAGTKKPPINWSGTLNTAETVLSNPPRVSGFNYGYFLLLQYF